MVKRKDDDDLFYLIFRRIPWWASVMVIALIYLILGIVLPLLSRHNALGQISTIFAPWIFLVLALLAAKAEWHKYQRRSLLDMQSSSDTIRNMNWQEFEHLVGEAYRRSGYEVEERGGAQADGGVDIVLHRNGQQTLVQCKHWRRQQVGVSVIRELYGVMAGEKAARGVIVTCGYFTLNALAFARDKPLQLVGGAELLELVRRGQLQDHVPLRTIPAELPMPQPVLPGQMVKPTISSANQPFCPVCRLPMRLKEARRGSNAGSQFWGCSAYPRCRGTRQI